MIFGRRPVGTIGVMGGLMSLPTPFCQSLANMVQYNNEFLHNQREYVHLDFAGTSFHSWARNGLAERFLGDWLFQLDTDHEFDPDLTCRMVKAMEQANLDVVTGLYVYKPEPHAPTIYHWDEEAKAYCIIGDWSNEADLLEISCAGGGCLLVRRSVFDRIRIELHEHPFDIIPPFSEDFSFFQRCMKLGIKVYAAPKIESCHLTYQSLSLKDKHITEDRLADPKLAEATA